MAQVGNFSKLAQMREQAFYADATAQLARAQQVAVAERERLTRWLGLTGADAAYALPERLPDLPAAPFAPQDAEQTAMERRLDVQLAKRDAEGTAQTLGLTRATRFVNVLEVGYTNESETGDARKNGYEIELELPLFDWGTSRVARAELLYMQALARTAQVGRQRAIRSARGVRRLSHRIRPREALPRRDRAAAPAHRRREPAALQRHADRRVRAARRRARAGRQRQRRHRGHARLLAGRDRPAAGACRQVARNARLAAGRAPATRSTAPAGGH